MYTAVSLPVTVLFTKGSYPGPRWWKMKKVFTVKYKYIWTIGGVHKQFHFLSAVYLRKALCEQKRVSWCLSKESLCRVKRNTGNVGECRRCILSPPPPPPPPPSSCILGAFAKLPKVTISFVMSVRPQGTSRLPLDGFWWNLIFELFPKIWWQNSSFIKIWQE